MVTIQWNSDIRLAGLIITTEAGIAEAPKKGGSAGGGMPGGIGGMDGMM